MVFYLFSGIHLPKGTFHFPLSTPKWVISVGDVPNVSSLSLIAYLLVEFRRRKYGCWLILRWLYHNNITNYCIIRGSDIQYICIMHNYLLRGEYCKTIHDTILRKIRPNGSSWNEESLISAHHQKEEDDHKCSFFSFTRRLLEWYLQ